MRRLKKELLSSGQADATSLQALESAISRTEGNIEVTWARDANHMKSPHQEQSRRAVRIMHNHVATLPAAVERKEMTKYPRHHKYVDATSLQLKHKMLSIYCYSV